MQCPQCLEQVPRGKFCDQCGFNLTSAAKSDSPQRAVFHEPPPAPSYQPPVVEQAADQKPELVESFGESEINPAGSVFVSQIEPKRREPGGALPKTRQVFADEIPLISFEPAIADSEELATGDHESVEIPTAEIERETDSERSESKVFGGPEPEEAPRPNEQLPNADPPLYEHDPDEIVGGSHEVAPRSGVGKTILLGGSDDTSAKDLAGALAQLVLKQFGRETSRTFPIFGSVVVGRFDPSTGPVDIDLSGISGSEHVSRHHAKIEPFGDRWIVRDLDSANGVFLRRRNADKFGPRQVEAHLSDGDEIAFGQIILIFRIERGIPK